MNVVHRYDNKKEMRSVKQPLCKKIRGHGLYRINYSRARATPDDFCNASSPISHPFMWVGEEAALNHQNSEFKNWKKKNKLNIQT